MKNLIKVSLFLSICSAIVAHAAADRILDANVIRLPQGSGSTLALPPSLLNAPSGFSGSLLDLKLNGTSQFSVSSSGDITGNSFSAGKKGLVPAPSAGDVVLDKFLKADGTWSLAGNPLQQGSKNYLSPNNAETNATTGWSLSSSTVDSTTKLPNQTSGSWTSANANLALSTVSSGQLAGSYSYRLASSSATTAGNMLVSDTITLDAEAASSVQTFSFFYKVATNASNGNFSGTSSNSFAVAIYDVTAGAWIDPAGRYNIVQSSGVGKAAGTFQVPSSTTQVRLAIYFPNASSGAITLYIDDFYLGPQTVQYGAPVADWKDFTPTFSGMGTGSYTSASGRWRRVGDSMEIQVEALKDASGGTGANVITATIPDGFTIDDSKLDVGSTGASTVGSFLQASSAYSGVVLYRSGTTVYFYTGTASGPFTGAMWGAGSQISAFATLPIKGWASTVQMSDSTDTRIVATRRAGATATSFSADTLVTFGSAATVDTHSGWVSSSQYSVAVAGPYRISTTMLTDVTALGSTGAFQVYYRVNNGASNRLAYVTGNGNAANYAASGSDLVNLNAGDVITFRVTSSGTQSLNSGLVSIERLSGPSTIAANELVAATYTINSSTTVANGSTPTLINYGNRVVDTHGSVTTGASTWKFTAPVSGKYEISGSVPWGAAENWTVNYYNQAYLFKGGSQAYVLSSLGVASTGFYRLAANIIPSFIIHLNAGEYIDIRATHQESTPRTVSTALNDAYICIKRIGN